MKNYFLIIALAILSTVFFESCEYGWTVTGSGYIVKDTTDLPAFDGFVIEGSMDVVLTYGETQLVIVETDDNILSLIDIEVYNGLCHIDYRPNTSINNVHTRIYITLPLIKEINIAGSGDVLTSNSFENQDVLEIIIGGSGDVAIEFYGNELEVEIIGSGDIDLAGSVDKNSIIISGSGDIDAFDLSTNITDIRIYGSGNTRCFVNDELDVTIGGSGNIYYKGFPTISQNIYGSGRIYNYN